MRRELGWAHWPGLITRRENGGFCSILQAPWLCGAIQAAGGLSLSLPLTPRPGPSLPTTHAHSVSHSVTPASEASCWPGRSFDVDPGQSHPKT